MGLQFSKVAEFMKKASAWSARRDSYTYFSGSKDDIDKYDFEDEARRLLKEIKLSIEEVQESQFYADLKEQIASDDFCNQLKSVLGSQSKVNMVLYALGSLAYNYTSHLQLALALLLKQDCSWINQIEVYDPIFVPTDAIVLKELGCHVLKFNERGRRKVQEPTLFYMPYPEFHLVGNLLEANWSPCRINKLIILTNKMEGTSKFDEYTRAIHNYTKKMILPNCGEEFGDYVLDNFAWHFFQVNSQMDMKTLFEGKFSKKSSLMRRRYENDHIEKVSNDFLAEEKLAEEKFLNAFVRDESKEEENWNTLQLFESFRGPRKYRCYSKAPPKDWIKLNISGIAADGNALAGYGGICHDEFMKPILSYKGFLNSNVDETAACVEALKHGLTDLIDKAEGTNLIVEGDNLKFIHLVNKRHEVRKALQGIDDQSFDDVCDLLMEFKCVHVYHIYEEANLKAYELAREGAMSCYKKRKLF